MIETTIFVLFMAACCIIQFVCYYKTGRIKDVHIITGMFISIYLFVVMILILITGLSMEYKENIINYKGARLILVVENSERITLEEREYLKNRYDKINKVIFKED